MTVMYGNSFVRFCTRNINPIYTIDRQTECISVKSNPCNLKNIFKFRGDLRYFEETITDNAFLKMQSKHV